MEVHSPGVPIRRLESQEETVHFRPPRRRYTQPSTLMTLSRFAPMIDMSFLLLIFFMTTTRFAEPEGLLSAATPQVRGGGAGVGLPVSPIVIRLAPLDVSGEGVSLTIDRFDDAPQDFAELPGFLRRIQEQPGFDEQTPVVIVAQNDVSWDGVVGAWNAAVRAGAKRIAFAEP